MGVVRNFIDIVGISSENELPKEILGQVNKESLAETILIEEDVNIKNIYQIIIDVQIEDERVINSTLSKFVVLDMVKKIKMTYYNDSNNVRVLEIERPLNYCIDIKEREEEIQSINIYIVDAYFKLISKRELYTNIVYLIDVIYYGGRRNSFFNNFHENKSVDLKDEDSNPYNEYNQFKDYIAVAKSDDVDERENREENQLMDIDAEYL